MAPFLHVFLCVDVCFTWGIRDRGLYAFVWYFITDVLLALEINLLWAWADMDPLFLLDCPHDQVGPTNSISVSSHLNQHHHKFSQICASCWPSLFSLCENYFTTKFEFDGWYLRLPSKLSAKIFSWRDPSVQVTKSRTQAHGFGIEITSKKTNALWYAFYNNSLNILDARYAHFQISSWCILQVTLQA